MESIGKYQKKALIVYAVAVSLLTGVLVEKNKEFDRVWAATMNKPKVEASVDHAPPTPKFFKTENERYADYIEETYDLNTERTETLLRIIDKIPTEVPKSLILAIIEHESKFVNKQASNPKEDSMGYVQMKSDTIKYLKSLYPELPTVRSQKEFQSSPATQIKYLVKYIEVANKKFSYDWERVVSSYNMGLSNEKLNEKYVASVSAYKQNYEKMLQVQ